MKNYSEIQGYYPNNNTVKLGGHEITLKNCKEQIGHDDSLPYSARLFIDGKIVCSLYNDGWGGETFITQVVDTELLKQANNDIGGLPFAVFPWDMTDERFKCLPLTSVIDVADLIAEHILWLADMKRKYGVKTSIIAVKSEDVKISKIEKRACDISNSDIIAAKLKCKALIADGYTIVNCPQFYWIE